MSETDANGTIIFANEAFCRISKYSLDQLIGKPHSIIRHPDMPSQLFTLLWSTIKAGEVFRGIIKNKAKDGSHYWVNATIMPVRGQNEEIEKYIGVRHLIVDQRLAQELFNVQVKSFAM
jgi:PAS domain S-box-containing protein